MGETSGDLRFTDTRRPDHDDVLWRHFITQFRRELLASPSVPQGDRHGALGLKLADDISVELGHDLFGG
jgi:hypothetical protein